MIFMGAIAEQQRYARVMAGFAAGGIKRPGAAMRARAGQIRRLPAAIDIAGNAAVPQACE